MKTVNVICTELKKIVLSPYFFIGVAAFALMCFSSSGYLDPVKNKEYSIFEMIGMLDEPQAKSNDFSAQAVCSRGLGGWLMMFLCIIVSFPSVKLLCDERRCNEKRYIISRMGVFRYCLSKFVCAVVSAGLICAGGFLLFSGAVHIIFPQAEPDMLAYTTPYRKLLAQAVLTGICVAVLPFLICSFTANPYFCICIPFLIQYMYNTALSKFMLDTAGNAGNFRKTAVRSVSPTNIGSIFYDTRSGCYTLIIYVVLAGLSLLVFSFAQRRCTDIGQ
jgi:hypothetical protein